MTSQPIPTLRSVLIGAALALSVGFYATGSRAQDTSAGYGAQVTTDGVTVGGWGFAAIEGGGSRPSVTTLGSGDLAKVALKAATFTGPTGPGGCDPNACSYAGAASTSMWDTIILTNSSAGTVDIPYLFTVDGRVTGGDNGSASAIVEYYFGDNRARWFNNGRFGISGDYQVGGTISLLANQTRTLYWRAALSTTAARGGVSDFSHTMTFDWELPEGVTYVSRSTQFMTAVAGVPEPASWALMILGFGSAGALIRTRRVAATA
jgi:hypothetical protein